MGPVADPTGAYGVAIVEAPSLEALEALQAQDPAILSGRGFVYREFSDADDRRAAKPAARACHVHNTLSEKGASRRD